jgi:hypothetical protein
MQAAICGFGERIFGSPRARGDVEYPISISDFHSDLAVQNIPQPGPNFQIFKFRIPSISEPQYLYIRRFPLQLHFQIQSYVHFPNLTLTHPKPFQLTSSQPNPMSMLQEPRSNPPPQAAAPTSQAPSGLSHCHLPLGFYLWHYATGTLPLCSGGVPLANYARCDVGFILECYHVEQIAYLVCMLHGHMCDTTKHGQPHAQ